MNNNPLSIETLTSMFKTSPKDNSRIINREGSTLEFKESYNHASMAQYFKAIASFANNDGGYILFGIGDKPRTLIGLKGKSLNQFENLQVEVFTKNLLDYFSPEIQWTHCTFEFQGKSFGVIYVYELNNKPCICKKNYNDSNAKYTLNEGDIYYRYGGRSEKIKYSELQSIIDERRQKEEKNWLKLLSEISKIGVENSAIMDLKSGKIGNGNPNIIIDEKLLKQIKFIHEGHFNEISGDPTLKIIGEISDVSSGKVIISENTKKTMKAIEPVDLILNFLYQTKIDEPFEYIKYMCSSNTSCLPIYYYINCMGVSINSIICKLEQLTSRSYNYSKRKIIVRLSGKLIKKVNPPVTDTPSSRQKLVFYNYWITEDLPNEISNINYCIESILYMNDIEIITHKTYILKSMAELFKNYYDSSPNIANSFRKVICRLDEVLYLNSI